MQGGRSLTPPGTVRVVPQRQKSKGSLIITAALELSTNQVTHFYSEKKNTGEMIKLLEVLVKQYAEADRVYLSWDAASWHASKLFYKRVDLINSPAYRAEHKTPQVELAPLASSVRTVSHCHRIHLQRNGESHQLHTTAITRLRRFARRRLTGISPSATHSSGQIQRRPAGSFGARRLRRALSLPRTTASTAITSFTGCELPLPVRGQQRRARRRGVCARAEPRPSSIQGPDGIRARPSAACAPAEGLALPRRPGQPVALTAAGTKSCRSRTVGSPVRLPLPDRDVRGPGITLADSSPGPRVLGLLITTAQ